MGGEVGSRNLTSKWGEVISRNLTSKQGEK